MGVAPCQLSDEARQEGASICVRCSEIIVAVAASGQMMVWRFASSDDATLRGLQRAVDEQTTGHDLDAHADLARAYAEMGLFDDAVSSAAVALRSASPTSIALRTALGVLLSADVLRPHGLARLRSLVRQTGYA